MTEAQSSQASGQSALRSQDVERKQGQILNNKYVIAGVNIGASIVEMLVIPTDNATSPCAKKLITLEDVPPGHVPTNTKPTNNASSILNNFPNTNANNGIIVNCDKHPMITFLGCLNTITKSSGFIVSPIPNITTINK